MKRTRRLMDNWTEIFIENIKILQHRDTSYKDSTEKENYSLAIGRLLTMKENTTDG